VDNSYLNAWHRYVSLHEFQDAHPLINFSSDLFDLLLLLLPPRQNWWLFPWSSDLTAAVSCSLRQLETFIEPLGLGLAASGSFTCKSVLLFEMAELFLSAACFLPDQLWLKLVVWVTFHRDLFVEGSERSWGLFSFSLNWNWDLTDFDLTFLFRNLFWLNGFSHYVDFRQVVAVKEISSLVVGFNDVLILDGDVLALRESIVSPLLILLQWLLEFLQFLMFIFFRLNTCKFILVIELNTWSTSLLFLHRFHQLLPLLRLEVLNTWKKSVLLAIWWRVRISICAIDL